MVRRVSSLSGRVPTRPSDLLDSSRYILLDLSQAEPNPGNPPFDGAVFTSNADGTRSWTSSLTLNSLAFNTGNLDSAGPNELYVLAVKGDPFDGINDSIGVRRIDLNEIVETDTLATVTSRGNTTTNDITVGKVTADSAIFNYSVTIQGDLVVNGTTTTFNTETLTVEDINITIASGAVNAAAANNAGITVAGANATILYISDSDAWKFNKVALLENGLRVTGNTLLRANLQVNGITNLDSTTVNQRLYVLDVPESTSNSALYYDTATGLIIRKTVVETPAVPEQIQITSTNDDQTFYPAFVEATSGPDSVRVDTNLTYNASTNRLTAGRLSLNQIALQDEAIYVLTITGDSVGYRTVTSLAAEEQDTLDTVTNRGNTTLNDITVGKVTADSAVFNNNVLVSGNLTVQGTTTTINSTELTVVDKNIILAKNAADAFAADSGGITLEGANAQIYYKQSNDAWHFNKDILVLGSLTADSVTVQKTLTVNELTTLDSTTINGYLKLNNVPVTTASVTGLFIDGDNNVVQRSIADTIFSGIASTLTVRSTDSNASFYPVFTKTTGGTDSANVDTGLSYNPSTNRLTFGRLSLTQLNIDSGAPFLLTLRGDSVGYRPVSSILEADTLDTVTDRGNTTTNAITVGDLTANITSLDSTTVTGNLKFTNQLLDNSNRRLIIYDSAGAVLWGA